MNATTLSLNSSHASLISHPDEIADLIINATKVSDLTQQTAPKNEVDSIENSEADVFHFQ